jgi:hypothetical protein
VRELDGGYFIGRGYVMRILVEPQYLRGLLRKYTAGRNCAFSNLWDGLGAYEFPLAGRDTSDISVGEILDACHAEASQLLQDHNPALLEERCDALKEMGRLYGYSDFTTTIQDATSSMSPCGIVAHGKQRGKPVVLPDECTPAHVLGIYSLHTSKKEDRIVQNLRAECRKLTDLVTPEIQELLTLNGLRCHLCDGLLLTLNGLRCHLCDGLDTVIDRAREFIADLSRHVQALSHPIASTITSMFTIKDQNTLILGVIPEGFHAYSSLRKWCDADLHLLVEHESIKPVAIRRGVAVPIIRSWIPVRLWEAFPPPVRAFVLEAAETFATPAPLPLRRPTKEDFKNLYNVEFENVVKHGKYKVTVQPTGRSEGARRPWRWATKASCK